MPHVEIRRSTFLRQVLRKSLVGNGAWPFVGKRIDTLGPAVEEVELITVREPSGQARVQRVVVGVDVGSRNVNGKGKIVGWNHWLHQSLIDQSNQLVAGTSLVANGCCELLRQCILAFKRIAVDVSSRRVGQRAIDLDCAIARSPGRRINAHGQRRIRRVTEG